MEQKLLIHFPTDATCVATGVSLYTFQKLQGQASDPISEHFLKQEITLGTMYMKRPIRLDLNTAKLLLVRNPWDRLVSVYEYLRQGGNGKSNSALAEHVNRYKTFNHFANDMLTEPEIQLNKLLRPQVTFLCNPRGEIMVDFVGGIRKPTD